MYKLGLLLLVVLAVASAKPVFPVAYTAPVVTATSSQYFARNYNGVYSLPYVAAAAPLTAPVAAPLVASSAYSYAPAFVY